MEENKEPQNYSWQKEWEEYFEDGTYIEWVPHESLVRFVARWLKSKNPQNTKVLDHGCGAGRHTIYLAEKGYSTYGVDISQKGLEIAQQRLASKNLEADLKQGNIYELPYPKNYFDAIVSFGVLDHILFKNAKVAINEVCRVLKSNGLLYLTLRSSRDTDCGRGEEIEQNTFIIPSHAEAGIPQHFYTGREIIELLQNFQVEYFEADERLIGEYLSTIYSRWVIIARKESIPAEKV